MLVFVVHQIGECPACLAQLIWMVREMRGKWPCNSCFISLWWNKMIRKEKKVWFESLCYQQFRRVNRKKIKFCHIVLCQETGEKQVYIFITATSETLLEKQGRTNKRCTLMDPHTWPCKSRTTSTNIHSAAMWGYGMLSWRPT